MKELKVWFEYLLKNPSKNESKDNKAKIGLLYNVLGRLDKRIHDIENIKKTHDVYKKSLEKMRKIEDRVDMIFENIRKDKEKLDEKAQTFIDGSSISIVECQEDIEIQDQGPEEKANKEIPTRKYKNIVKSKEELLKWFDDNGYEKVNEGYISEDDYKYFMNEMFDYCGKEIDNKYFWLTDWLTKIPVDIEKQDSDIFTKEEWIDIKTRIIKACKKENCSVDHCVMWNDCNNNFNEAPLYWRRED